MKKKIITPAKITLPKTTSRNIQPIALKLPNFISNLGITQKFVEDNIFLICIYFAIALLILTKLAFSQDKLQSQFLRIITPKDSLLKYQMGRRIMKTPEIVISESQILDEILAVDEELNEEEEEINVLESEIEGENLEGVSESLEVENQDVNVTHNDRVVVLLSLHRTETGIISDLFNAHPEVFFSYEPLSLIHHGCDTTHSAIAAQISGLNEYLPVAEKHALHWLDSFASCKFEQTVKPLVTALKNRDHHIPGNFPNRHKNGKLCSNEYCAGLDYSQNPKQCWKNCPPVNLFRAKNTCENSRVKVIRAVRVCRIEELHRLVHAGRVLRIVLVTRDPRAVAMSRLSNHQIELPELVIDMKRMCYEKYENILTMIKATTNLQEEHSWLKNDAYIIRYEDLIKETRQQASKLLKFANLTLLPAHEPHFEKVLNEAQSEKLDDWRKFLDLDDVEHIQEVCEGLMTFMGYKNFFTHEDLIDEKVASFDRSDVFSKQVEIADRIRTLSSRKNRHEVIPGVLIRGHGVRKKSLGGGFGDY